MNENKNENKVVLAHFRGQELQPNWKCWWGFHDWTRWVTMYSGRYINSKTRYEELRKECKRCGMAKLREVRE